MQDIDDDFVLFVRQYAQLHAALVKSKGEEGELKTRLNESQKARDELQQREAVWLQREAELLQQSTDWRVKAEVEREVRERERAKSQAKEAEWEAKAAEWKAQVAAFEATLRCLLSALTPQQLSSLSQRQLQQQDGGSTEQQQPSSSPSPRSPGSTAASVPRLPSSSLSSAAADHTPDFGSVLPQSALLALAEEEEEEEEEEEGLQSAISSLPPAAAGQGAPAAATACRAGGECRVSCPAAFHSRSASQPELTAAAASVPFVSPRRRLRPRRRALSTPITPRSISPREQRHRHWLMTQPSPHRLQQLERLLPRLLPEERIVCLEVVTLDGIDSTVVHHVNVLTSAFIAQPHHDDSNDKDEKSEASAAAGYWQLSRWRSAESLSLLPSDADGQSELERCFNTVCPLCQQDGQSGLFAAHPEVQSKAMSAATPLLFRYDNALDPASNCHYLCILFAQLPLAPAPSADAATSQLTLAAALPQPQRCCEPDCSLPGFFPLCTAYCINGCEALAYCRQHLPVEHLHLASMLCLCCTQARQAWDTTWKTGGADDLPVQKRKAEVALALLATPLKPAECRRAAAGRRDIALLQPLSCELKERLTALGDRRALMELMQSWSTRPQAAIEDEECLQLTERAEMAEADGEEAEAAAEMAEDTEGQQDVTEQERRQNEMAPEAAEQEQEENVQQNASHSRPEPERRKRRRVVLQESSSNSSSEGRAATSHGGTEAETERKGEDCGQRRRKRRTTTAAAAPEPSPRKTRSQSVRSLTAQRRRQQGQREATLKMEEAGWELYDPRLWETRPSQPQSPPQAERRSKDEENEPPSAAAAAPAACKKTRKLGKAGPPLRPEQQVDACEPPLPPLHPPLPGHLRQSSAPTAFSSSSSSFCTLLSASQYQTLRHPLARLSEAVVTARANVEAAGEGGGDAGSAAASSRSSRPSLMLQQWKATSRPTAAASSVGVSASQRQSLAAARMVAQKVVHYQLNGRGGGRRA